jgi:oligosaccharide reducing-end xylanase
MYHFKLLFIALFVFGAVLLSTAQNVDKNYEVATWRGFAEVAVTYTFDDNCANQYEVAIPALDEYGFKGTFYPVINWEPDWQKFQQAANNGHEIGSHTVTHRNLSELSSQEQEKELAGAKKIIETKIDGQQCLTFAYPFCIPSEPEVTRENYIAARHCQGAIEKPTPDDFYNISSIICGDQWPVYTAKHFEDKLAEALKSNGWCVWLFHGIEDDGGYSPVSTKDFRESLAYLDENRSRFWTATFVDVVRYIKQRDCVNITEKKRTRNTIEVEVSDSLNNQIYNMPLTIRCKLPNNWESATIKQGGEVIPGKIVASNILEFEAKPDNGIVAIKK